VILQDKYPKFFFIYPFCVFLNEQKIKLIVRISKNFTEILFHDLMIKDHESYSVQFP